MTYNNFVRRYHKQIDQGCEIILIALAVAGVAAFLFL